MNSIFISVRTDSTRLPKKAILDIHGFYAIEHLIHNLKNSKLADDIILCTTKKKSDDILCRIADKNNIKCFRGSSEDKLLRWKSACEKHGVEFFVNVDGDDLFFDHGLADIVFKQYHNSKADFIDGQGLYNDVYGVSKKGIQKVCENKTNTNTEFIKLYFQNLKHLIKIEKLLNVPDLYHKKNIRMTLDYAEDLEFFRTVIGEFRKHNRPMTFDNIISFLKKNPSVIKINWSKEQSWKQNQAKMVSKIKQEGI